VKASGAPDTGDLVQATALGGLHIYPTLGIILECRGIECLVMWAGPVEGNWWPRSQLKVISESR
jgi:hypothetical protein